MQIRLLIIVFNQTQMDQEINLPKLTGKQEKFAQLLGTTNMNQSDAYRMSYDAENMSPEAISEEAYRLTKHPEVSLRISHIKNESQLHLKYDAEAHFKELEELKKLALTPMGKDGNIDVKAGIKATELKGKLTGLYVEKSEVKYPQGIDVKIVTGGN